MVELTTFRTKKPHSPTEKPLFAQPTENTLFAQVAPLINELRKVKAFLPLIQQLYRIDIKFKRLRPPSGNSRYREYLFYEHKMREEINKAILNYMPKIIQSSQKKFNLKTALKYFLDPEMKTQTSALAAQHNRAVAKVDSVTAN